MTVEETFPAGIRKPPADWIELSDVFLRDVEIGVHAGWSILPDEGNGLGENVVYMPQDGVPQAWHVRRDRILGSPIPVVCQEAIADV